MSNYQRFLQGEYCNMLDSEVLEMIIRNREYLSIVNDMKISENERKMVLLKMFGSIGKYSSVGYNFSCQCGKHIFVGEKTIINDNCTMMDENQIVDGRDKPADTLHSVGLSVHKFIFEGKEIFYLFVEQEVGQIELLII